MRTDKKSLQKTDKKTPSRTHNRGVVGYSKKSALLEEAITHMNTGKYGRSSAALKQLLALDPQNTEARRLFATLHLRLGSLVTARQAFESLAKEAIERQDFWLAESLLREYLVAGPRCIPFLELLAQVHEVKGDAVAAVTELGKAIDILIEDPDSENPKKPSQLYTKVRELAPASSVACQLASLFDIQTGELLVSRPLAPAATPSLEVDVLHTTEEIPTTDEESNPSNVMPWEQPDRAHSSHETLPPTSSNSVIESFDIPEAVVDPALAVLPPQELNVPPSESTGSIQDANRFVHETAPSKLTAPPFPLNGDHHEQLAPSSPEKYSVGDGSDVSPSVDSVEVSSPLPWEQIENSTIPIEETSQSTVPIVQSEGTSLLDSESVLAPPTTTQPEPVSGQLANRAYTPDLTEPSVSIFAVEPSTSPAELPELETTTLSATPEPVDQLTEPGESIFTTGPAPSLAELSEPESPPSLAADASPTAPLSWNNIFDGAWKFAAGTLSSSSPTALSKPYASLQDARELEPVQPESDLSAPSSTATSDLPVSFSAPDFEPDSLPAPDPSIVSGSIERANAIEEPDVPSPTPVLISEEPSLVEASLVFASEARSSVNVDLPVPSLPEPVEPTQSSEPVTTGQHEIPITLLKNSDTPSTSPSPIDTSAQWSTGEVAVQPHRLLEKKRQWDKEKGDAPVGQPAPLPVIEESSESVAELSRTGGWEAALSDAVTPVVEAVAPIEEKPVLEEDTRPEWIRASESITFMDPPLPSSSTWQDPGTEATLSRPEPELSVAASAVDVLFDSTENKRQVHTLDRVATPRRSPRLATRIARIRIGISSFIGTCFSTTRSIVLLCVGLTLSSVALVAVGIGAIGLAWIMMEAPPSSVYHNLTVSPSQALTDSRKNGYFLLLGFDATEEQNPLQVGYERKAEESDLQAAHSCMLGDTGKGTTTTGASPNVVREWFTSADPAAQIALQTTAVRSWVTQESLALKRYQQWLPMAFEDAGYGQILSPNCDHILLAHRLYLAEGFAQGLNTGLERLETDMGSWRVVLEQSKTLMIKMLAATAVQDNIALASGLLIRQGFDGDAVGRLGKIVRPLDPVELSLRWPMQSHLAWGTKSVTTGLKNDKNGERPLHVALAAAMPLPVQRRANAYADYYEAASKSVAEGRYTSLPKLSSFIRTPAASTLDYLANPIEHIIGIEPLPSWDPYVGRIVETDARLRLASLQIWIRRGAQEESALARLAKAGQALYDPFTGLPMLLDQQKGMVYSVGPDGKDQDGDSLRDIVATIPKLNRS
ncbi:MAG: tetratricopeptide repeat protein [Nitrospira sp. CG24E]|nr:MAG: tetratricopeptide repeat protein [Nitrospira sp. CG24E]